MKTSVASAAPRLSSAEWDELRLAFHRSPMIETPLASLAQNIDGCVWRIEGADERPSAYIDLGHAEALARLRAHGEPATRLDELAVILRGTLAFDESFGEMAVVASRAEAGSDMLAKNMERLGLPADFPLELGDFSAGVRTFCAGAGIHTLGDFLEFARGASRQVMVGGEFRDLLNALAHIDEATLARRLPFRPRSRGLHLVEAVALLARPWSVEERMLFARRPDAVTQELREAVALRARYFSEQAEHARAHLAAGTPMARLVVSLDDLSLEAAVGALLAHELAPAPTVAPAGDEPVRRSWLKRLLGRAG